MESYYDFIVIFLYNVLQFHKLYIFIEIIILLFVVLYHYFVTILQYNLDRFK